ncbi:MAG: amidase, partial [Alphaproteobacteria bacterium]|nr:amidase [Alphaproteobacteria bacterium]
MTDTYATARSMLADLTARKVSARELLAAHVARNEQVHKKINAVIETDLKRAEKDAQAVDDARARGQAIGRLAGLPMTIKDGFDVQAMPATSGNPAFKDRAKDCADADVVDAVRREGAV